jgi:phosphatidylserine/phosphatidylglycerophosphate/cardiolipin synthase-like enzyme
VTGLLAPGSNCWKVSAAEQSSMLVDAHTYYKAFYRAAEQARRYILMCGWQFDSTVHLLRGAEAVGVSRPVQLIDFLDTLCRERPELRVYVLGWDYSFVYALEREWMLGLKVRFTTSQRLRFEYDSHPVAGGSHHQKFVVVDGAIGFAGGMDICESRWDDRQHRVDNPLRVDRTGAQYRPYHDVQVGIVGEAVADLTELFVERWQLATKETLELPAAGDASHSFDIKRLTDGEAIGIQSSRVGLSRTRADERIDGPVLREVRKLHEDAIAAAERLIYIETQYFTSRSVAKALIERMADPERPKLQVLILMPNGADTPKEKFALGDSQSAILTSVLEAASRTGHQVRLLYTVARDDVGHERPTFIHSKILIVDDRLLTVGSANLTNRSMGLDTELNLTWECSGEDDPLQGCIQSVRTSLLGEHTGIDCPDDLRRLDGLVARIDAICDNPELRLRRRLIKPPENYDPLMCAVFDPDGPELISDELFGSEEKSAFARGIQTLAGRVAKADLPDEPAAG